MLKKTYGDGKCYFPFKEWKGYNLRRVKIETST